MRRALLVLTVLPLVAAACGRGPKPSSSTSSVDPADSIFIPARRIRFYRDPDTNEPSITLVVSLQHDGKKRFILAQTKMQGGELAVVSDSAGLIPVFDSEREARDYVAKVFPLNAAGPDTSDDAVVAAYADMLAKGGTTHLDLDRARGWTEHPASRSAGPVELALLWETLAGADAALPMAQFDPMGMVGLQETAGRSDADSIAAHIIMVGMKLTGITSDLRRRGAEDDAAWPSGLSSIWSAEDDALLARIIRVGIANMGSRLSVDAAKRDVTQTWPAPQGPQLTASFLSSGLTTLDVQLVEPGKLTQTEIAEYVKGQVSNTPEPERASVSAGARARYARDRQGYADDVRAYIQASRKHDDEARRVVRMRVWLKNNGDQAADDLSVRFHVPGGVVVVPSGMSRFGPSSPEEPLAPAAYEIPTARRKRWDPRPRPSYRELGQTSMYNSRQQISRGANGTTIVEHPVVVIPGKQGGEAGELMVQFRDWRSVKPFDMDVEMRVAGAAVNTSRLHVNATVRRAK